MTHFPSTMKQKHPIKTEHNFTSEVKTFNPLMMLIILGLPGFSLILWLIVKKRAMSKCVCVLCPVLLNLDWTIVLRESKGLP